MTVEQYLQNPNLAKFPFLFIITFGRSGSTLLQGILNSIDGYEIKGENHGTLVALFMAARQQVRAKQQATSKTDPTHPWFGAENLDPEAFSQNLADVFLRMCLQPQKSARCTGFKEIRHLPEEIPDELFPEYLDFLQSRFPGAGLLFNVRETASAAESNFWAALDPEPMKRTLDATIERFTSYAAARANCFIFNYDSLIADPAYCEALFDFLGEPFDLADLKKILGIKHSSIGPHRASLLGSLKAKTDELKVREQELGKMAEQLRSTQAAMRNVEEEVLRKRRRVDRLEALVIAVRNSPFWNGGRHLGRMRLLGRKFFRNRQR
ncbi:MAG: sulfotransferase [Alphaproteobacteria bacterium]|nr:sulfotransferase [Alphaproteobacteria bacterium]